MTCIICYKEEADTITCRSCGNICCIKCLREMYSVKESNLINCCPYCTNLFPILILMRIDRHKFRDYIERELNSADMKAINGLRSMLMLLLKIERSYSKNGSTFTYTVVNARLMMEYLHHQNCEQLVKQNEVATDLQYIREGRAPPVVVTYRDMNALMLALRIGQSEILGVSKNTYFNIYNLVNSGRKRVTFKNLKATNVKTRLRDQWNPQLNPLLKQIHNDLVEKPRIVSYQIDKTAVKRCICCGMKGIVRKPDFRCDRCGMQYCRNCHEIAINLHSCSRYYLDRARNSIYCPACKCSMYCSNNRYHCFICEKSYLVDEDWVYEVAPLWNDIKTNYIYSEKKRYEKLMEIEDIDTAFKDIMKNRELETFYAICSDIIKAAKRGIDPDAFINHYTATEFPTEVDVFDGMEKETLSMLQPRKCLSMLYDYMLYLKTISAPVKLVELKSVVMELAKILQKLQEDELFETTSLAASIRDRILKFIELKRSRKVYFKDTTFEWIG